MSQIEDGMDNNCKIYIVILFPFSLSSSQILFTFLGSGLMGGLHNRWIRMGRSIVGGFELWVMAVGGFSFIGCGL